MKLNDYFELLRIKQWYKNVIVFLALIFSLNLFNFTLFLHTLIGFISLCLISSSYYIINDINDLEKDKKHPEKNTRPLAAGKISILKALIISTLLFNLSLIISYNISKTFVQSILVLFILSQTYTFLLRDIIYIDIIIISMNFVIRAFSGAFIINVPISSYFILSTFFLSVFLVSLKRSTEINSVSKNYRKNYTNKDKPVLEKLSTISITSVFLFFSIYSALEMKPYLLLSIPIALYIVLNFFAYSTKFPEKIRNPEKFIFDKKNLIALLLWGIIIVITFY